MEYEKHHILDFVIDDESRSDGCEVSVSVDTHEMTMIHFGNSFSIRTSYESVNDLRDVLHQALVEIESIRYHNAHVEDSKITENKMLQAWAEDSSLTREALKASDMSRRNEAMMKGTINPTDLNEYNPNDPKNW